MADKFSEDDRVRLQHLLDRKKLAVVSSSASYEAQHCLPAGSAARDAQGRTTNRLWDELGGVCQTLRDEGVLDGYGGLTNKARASGLRL